MVLTVIADLKENRKSLYIKILWSKNGLSLFALK